MKKPILLTATLTIALAICMASAHAQKNVIFIMADDFNKWVGVNDYYPYPSSNTPNIDALANSGVYFSNANSSFPVCNPSRNAIWSGYRPTTSGITTNLGGFIREQEGFEDIVTMHQYFKENGYYTVGAGKLYHATSMGGYDTDPDNWNKVIASPTGSDGGATVSWRSTVTGNDVVSWSAGYFDITTAEDTELAQEIADEIANYNGGETPFFIACGFFRPHLPWNFHMRFWNLFSDSLISPLEGYQDNDLADITGARPSAFHADIINNDKWTEAVKAYMAACSYADYNIGIVLDALYNSPYKDNTIVVVTGDHGMHLGEKEQWGKGTEYDQSNRTVLAIYDPSSIGNGQQCHTPVSLQDLYPTLVDIAGLPAKDDIEGNSLAPLLNNPQDASWDKPVLMYAKGSSIIKTKTWRLVKGNTETRVTPQLYNMIDDPYEFNNLYTDTDYAETITYLEGSIDSIIQAGVDLKAAIADTSASGIPTSISSKKEIDYLKSTFITDGILHLDLLTTNLIATLSIYNMGGQKIAESRVAGEQEVDYPLPIELSHGMYVLKVSSENMLLHTEKFILLR